MCSNLVFVVIACLCAISIAPASADVASTIVGLKDCCPGLPAIVKEATVNACMPALPIEKKKGYAAFGGSSPKNRSCVMQCAYKAENLLTTVGGNITLDLAAIEAQLTTVSNASWTDVLTQAKINCTAKQPNITKDSTKQNCTSGAYEISICLNKFLMTSCPASQLGTKAECASKLDNLKLTWFQKIKKIFSKKNATTTAAPAG